MAMQYSEPNEIAVTHFELRLRESHRETKSKRVQGARSTAVPF